MPAQVKFDEPRPFRSATAGEGVPMPFGVAPIRLDLDHELGALPGCDWLYVARVDGVPVAYAVLYEPLRYDDVHLRELAVDATYRGGGIGEKVMIAVAHDVVTRLPARELMSMQPLRDDRFEDRCRWFRSFGFAPDDEGIWFATAQRIAEGRHV